MACSQVLRALWSCIRTWVVARGIGHVGVRDTIQGAEKHGVTSTLPAEKHPSNNRRKGKGDGDTGYSRSGVLSTYAWRLLTIAFLQKRSLLPFWPHVTLLQPFVRNPCDVVAAAQSLFLKLGGRAYDLDDLMLELFPHIESILPAELKIAPTRNISRPEATVGGKANVARKRMRREPNDGSGMFSRAGIDGESDIYGDGDDEDECGYLDNKGREDTGALFHDFVTWICSDIDYKQHEVIHLHSESGKSEAMKSPLKPRGTHAWPRLRLSDPVESGRDLGSHLTKRGFTMILIESARAALLLRDGASFDSIASANH